MADDDNGEKTEQPTERRRQEVRSQGNIARSADLTAAGLLIGVASLLYFTGSGIVTTLSEFLQRSLEQDAWLRIDRGLSTTVALKSEPGSLPAEEKGLNSHQYIVPGAGGVGEILNNAWV